MKKASLPLFAVAVIAVLFLTACGSDSSTPAAPPTSRLTKRVFLANAFTGTTLIIDAANDILSTFTIRTTGRPAIMESVPAQNLTLLYEDLSDRVQFIDIGRESLAVDSSGNPISVTLGGHTESIALQSDAKFAYAAIRNLAAIQKIDIAARTITPINGIPEVRRVALSPNNAKLLAFSDNSDSVVIVNTADNTLTPVPGFDRPYTAVFASDSSRAFVLSCGAECGGTQAKISVLDLATSTITGEVSVDGATVGLLDGNNLYLAGNRVSAGSLLPSLNIVNTTNLSVTAPSVTIHDGLHTLMALGANGRLFIGGNNCTASCLTIYNTSAQSTVQSTQPGPVSSILPITGRSVVYAVENGDLNIYDTATDALQNKQIRTFGAVSVMNEVD